MDNSWITKNPQKSPQHHCCGYCGKKYKYSSGLSKHKKKCTKRIGNSSKEKARIDYLEAKVKEMEVERKNANEVLNVVRELANSQQQANQNLSETLKDILPAIGNYNNNKISINVFLNEHCKDAMNLTDFVDKIKISIEDLMYTNEKGYTEGISNIFMKHLTDMKPTERPFHCSDKKRLHFYVKDEDKWGKDNKNEKITNTIQRVTMKQIKQLKEWENNHPGYLENDELTQEWQGMIHKMMGGGEDMKRCEDKIVKNLSNKVCMKNELIAK